MVSAYSSRITAYCLASSGSRASASSTRRASRAFSVPAACHGSSSSISPGSCSSIFLLKAICLPQFCQFLALIEQARLHSVLRYPDDFGHLFHGLLVVVDEIDDFP